MNIYYKDDLCTLIQGECIEVMTKMAEKGLKFDAIITDIPYGTTHCKWDSIIPLDKMWACIKSLLKSEKSIFLTTASQPFTSILINSNLEWFKYCLVWDKQRSSGSLNANRMPLKYHEDICVFSPKTTKYNPIMTKGIMMSKGGGGGKSELYGDAKELRHTNDLYYPKSILPFKACHNMTGKVHPTQKPVELYEYIIQTYTDKNDIILDFSCGSGTTLMASKKLGRKCYGIELEEKYCEITKNRLLEI